MSTQVKHKALILIAMVFTPFSTSSAGTAAQSGNRPCPGPANEAALIAVARAESSDERVIEWMTRCGVGFPVGSEVMERLVKDGVSARVVGASVTGRYFYMLSHPSDELIARILINMRPGSAASFSEDDKASLAREMATPNVAGIRKLLTQYLSAKLTTDPQDQRLAALLGSFPSASLTKRFAVVAVNPLLVGGEAVTIMFVDPSHLMLDVHVKDGVVTFLRQKPLEPEARDRLAAYYREILKDPQYLR